LGGRWPPSSFLEGQAVAGLFYQIERERRFPITLYFLELLAAESEARGPEADQLEIIACCITRAGLRAKPKRDDLTFAVERLGAIRDEVLAQDDGEPPKERRDRGLGTDFMRWLGGLGSEELCLFITDFDSERARAVYRGWDRDEVMQASRMCLQYEREKLKATYEATMYGFGGGYKSDPNRGAMEESGNTQVFDLTQDNPQGLAELQKALRAG
jgi:hypothetical protein